MVQKQAAVPSVSRVVSQQFAELRKMNSLLFLIPSTWRTSWWRCRGKWNMGSFRAIYLASPVNVAAGVTNSDWLGEEIMANIEWPPIPIPSATGMLMATRAVMDPGLELAPEYKRSMILNVFWGDSGSGYFDIDLMESALVLDSAPLLVFTPLLDNS